MDVVITLSSGTQSLTAEPAACLINKSICNDSLQHREDSCDVKFIYDPDLFAFIVGNNDINAAVKDRSGFVLFTGKAVADSSWADQGEPFPIAYLPITIKDYSAKLDTINAAEIALLDTALLPVITRLAGDCGLTLNADNIPETDLQVFVMPQGHSYRQTLDVLCYQYRLSFYFDRLGTLCFFNYDPASAAFPPLDEDDIMAGLQIKKSTKRFDAVKV
ncbi:MAG: hypothetical protein LBH16_09300, partial [Treponema sp.]|nr:hypothetical protein [Treponema sp.]